MFAYNFLACFCSFSSKKCAFIVFISVFPYSIKFLQQDINQSEIGIGDETLLANCMIFFVVQVVLALGLQTKLSCIEICMFLCKSQKFALPFDRSLTHILLWNFVSLR